MPAPPSNLLVSVLDSVAFVKIAGRANFTISVHFKTLITELAQRGFNRFVLDLSDCLIMDSTFLGVISKISLDFDSHRRPNGEHPITLLNPNPKVADLLDNMGVLGMFSIVTGSTQTPNHYQLATPSVPPSKEQTSRTCLEAHQTLAAINPANLPKFKDVIRFFEEDLKRLKSSDKD